MAPELFHFTYACPDNPWCGGGGAQRDFEILHHLEKDWKVSVFCGTHLKAGCSWTPCRRENLGLPFLGEKYSLLARAQFFCSPSRFEGWCIAAIEASSQGLPVVATRTDGFLDSAPDGYTSILVNNDDDESYSAELASAFQRLLTEPELRTRLGTNGSEWARRFDWPSTARMQGEFYQQVLDCLHGAPLPPPGIVNTMESFLPT